MRAKQRRRVALPEPVAAPASEASRRSLEPSGSDRHLIVFRVAGDMFGFEIERVGEIGRLPALAFMPLAPPSLLGIANRRGDVLPVVSLHGLLGRPEAPTTEATRVIVTSDVPPVGFAVDEVLRLLTIPEEQIDKAQAGAGDVDPNVLQGVIKGSEGAAPIKILNPRRLLRDQFARLSESPARGQPRTTISTAPTAPILGESEEARLSFLSFELGGQEYAVPLESVNEIVALPDHVSEIPRAETGVLGVVTSRERLLPLVSLRALLGMPASPQPGQRSSVLVLSIGSGVVGIVADRMREILRVQAQQVDPAPALLTRGEGDAEITSICRLDDGRRLVALLTPDNLFRPDLVQRILGDQTQSAVAPAASTEDHHMSDEQFLIFRIGAQEFGIPVGAVEEIARPPEHITRLPKAPSFIEGVMNLRGAVLPIIDLRRRFHLANAEPGGTPRILVLTFGGRKTGFLVDGVTEVLKVPGIAISPAPELSAEQTRMITRVANLEARNRMILLVEPAPLLDRVEADILAAFDPSALEKVPAAS
jgi:purine-binding chemotaxis protein CheW